MFSLWRICYNWVPWISDVYPCLQLVNGQVWYDSKLYVFVNNIFRWKLNGQTEWKEADAIPNLTRVRLNLFTTVKFGTLHIIRWWSSPVSVVCTVSRCLLKGRKDKNGNEWWWWKTPFWSWGPKMRRTTKKFPS